MKKLLSCVLTVLLLLPIFTIGVTATDDSPSFSFVLSVDGEETKEVQTGDVVTVVLKLRRTDVNKPYTMYAMQNEIRYDEKVFAVQSGI